MTLYFLKIFWLALATSAIGLSACQPQIASLQPPEPLRQDYLIQAYFNNHQAKAANYTDPYRQITRPGDDLEQIIIVDAISSARQSVEVAVFELRLPKIAQALAERYQAGVKVRVILDNSYSLPFSQLTPSEINQLDERAHSRYEEYFALIDLNRDGQLSDAEINQRDALVILRNAGVPLIDDTADGSRGSGFMHHKFVIVDNNTVLTGSANLTLSGIHGDLRQRESRGNANNLLKIKASGLAKLFTEEFNLMWGDGPGGELDSKFGKNKPFREPQQVNIGETVITVQFSPTSPRKPWNLSSNGLINKTLERATQSVNLALFVFSEQRLANTLETIDRQGIPVKALLDRGFAFRYYSEGLDLLGVALTNNCKYEKDNLPWREPITTVGVPQLPPGDKLHHKFAVVDRQTVITGSHNWSASANYSNDEAVLIIENPTVAAHFTREFDRLYGKAVLGVPTYVRTKIEAQKQQCS